MPPFIALHPHPSTPCAAIHRFEARARFTPDAVLSLGYRLEGEMDKLGIPAPMASARADGLWRHTCCEAFLAVPGQPGYLEFNLAPSGAWAVYRFVAYRDGMATAEPIEPPLIHCERAADRLELSATIDLRGLLADVGEAFRVALSAVIEDRGGALSYWALAHPEGKPDFHHEAGFALRLTPSHP